MMSDDTSNHLFHGQEISSDAPGWFLTAAKPISAMRRIIDARREMTGMVMNAMRCCVIVIKLVEVQCENVGETGKLYTVWDRSHNGSSGRDRI